MDTRNVALGRLVTVFKQMSDETKYHGSTTCVNKYVIVKLSVKFNIYNFLIRRRTFM